MTLGYSTVIDHPPKTLVGESNLKRSLEPNRTIAQPLLLKTDACRARFSMCVESLSYAVTETDVPTN